MYGLIGQMMAVEGQREALIGMLLQMKDEMPGCLIYVIAEDQEDANAIWISEVWTDKQSHADSLQLTHVQSTIAKARPLIAGFGHRFETNPRGGVGLPG